MTRDELEALSRAEDELIWWDALDKMSKTELRAEIERLKNSLPMQTIAHLTTEIERLNRDYVALELECASWKQSSALKLAEIERLRARVAELEQRPTDEEIKAAMCRALENKP